MKGKLIVIEGTDCSGKETQSNLLVEYLNSIGHKTKKFCFPNYNSATGKIIAGPYLGKDGYLPPLFEEGASNVDPYCATLLFAMDRKYNIKEILNVLNEGYNVVLDRYVDSNMAHQGAKLESKDQEQMFYFIETLEYQLLKLPKADLPILLYMPIWASKKLKANRPEKPDQHEQDEKYLQKSEDTYLKIAKRRGSKIIECTNGNDILSIKEISTNLCEFVKGWLENKI